MPSRPSSSYARRAICWISQCSPDTAVAVAIPTLCTILFAEAYFRTSTADAESSAKCRYPPTAQLIRPEHVRELEETGYVVIPNVLTSQVLAQARKDVALIKSERRSQVASGEVGSDTVSVKGSLLPLATSSGTAANPHRGDSIHWLRESDGYLPAHRTFPSSSASPTTTTNTALGDGIYHCVKLLRGVPHALEACHYTTSHSHTIPRQCQLAQYPGNGLANYPRHLDQCAKSLQELGLLEYWRLSDYRRRSLTSILYLNESEWDGAVDGGQIRCYQRGMDDKENETSGSGTSKQQQQHEDVVPQGGKLLIFDSRRIEHEVLPSTRNRTALTSWVLGSSV
jgi:hypothetical protein